MGFKGLNFVYLWMRLIDNFLNLDWFIDYVFIRRLINRFNLKFEYNYWFYWCWIGLTLFISCIYWYGRWVLRVHSRTGSGVCPCAFFNWVGFVAVEFPVSKKRCGSIWYNYTRFWSEFGCFSGIWRGNLYLSFRGWVASSWESLSLCLKY